MRGLENPFVRWWVTFSIMAVAVTTTLAAGLGSFIAASDRTCLSWLILAIFFSASALLGRKVQKRGEEADVGVINYCIRTCTALGFLGTIIGLIIMIVGAFANLDVANHESLRVALVAMASGIGTALVTTLVGLVCALLLEFQVAVVREKWRA